MLSCLTWCHAGEALRSGLLEKESGRSGLKGGDTGALAEHAVKPEARTIGPFLPSQWGPCAPGQLYTPAQGRATLAAPRVLSASRHPCLSPHGCLRSPPPEPRGPWQTRRHLLVPSRRKQGVTRW